MLSRLYKSVMRRSTPLLEAYLRRRTKNGKEDPERAAERRGRPAIPRGKNALVWLHAASVGEAQSLLALINRLLAAYPGIGIMVTTGTVTSAKLMAERLPPGAFHQYIPVDHPDWTESFLDHWRPDLVLWAESEFWPNMLEGIRARGIPAVLLNARISQKSFRRWKLAGGFIRNILATFSLCLGQNEAEADRLLRLGAANVHVARNLKYAADPLPCDAEKLGAIKKALGNRPLLLWASTHPGEESLACRTHIALRRQMGDLLTIIVPRHPDRRHAVCAIIAGHGLEAVLRSEEKLPRKAEESVYVADTLGELGLFYSLSRLCILGGSFVPVGGHNPIEPARFGCQIFYGPHMFNFISICEDFQSRGAALQVKNLAQLQENIALALKDPNHFAGMGQTAKKWTEENTHVIDDLAATLAPFMESLTNKRKAVSA